MNKKRRLPDSVLLRKAIAAFVVGLVLLSGPARAQVVDSFGLPEYDRAAAYIVSGNTAAALDVLRKLEQEPPPDAGAWLDLGILYCEAGQAKDAERIFSVLQKRFAPPPSIVQLIDYYLALGCAVPGRTVAPAEDSRLRLTLGVAGGYASNVNFGPSSATVRLADGAPLRDLVLLPSSLAKGDTFLGLEAAAEQELQAVPGAYLSGGVRLRSYARQSDYDTGYFAAGVGYRTRVGEGSIEVLGESTQLWIGGNVYESTAGLFVSAWLGSGEVWLHQFRWGAEGNVTQSLYPGNGMYDARNTELRLKSQFKLREDMTMTFLVGLAQDKAARDRPGGDRSGGMLGLSLERAISNAHRIKFYFQHYSLAESTAYNPTMFGDIIRSPQSSYASLRYQYQFTRDQGVYLQFSESWRRDKIELFSLNSGVLALGYQWRY